MYLILIMQNVYLALRLYTFGANQCSLIVFLNLESFEHLRLQLISFRIYSPLYLNTFAGHHLSQKVMSYRYLMWFFATFSHLWNLVEPSLFSESCPTWLTMVCCHYTPNRRTCSNTITCEGPDEAWQCCREKKVSWILYFHKMEANRNPRFPAISSPRFFLT